MLEEFKNVGIPFNIGHLDRAMQYRIDAKMFDSEDALDNVLIC